MLLGEGVELLVQHPPGQPQRPVFRRRLELAVHLQQQAFLKVPRPNARRVELLHDVQHGFQLLFLHLDALTEGQIGGDRIQIAAAVARLVQVADQKRRKQTLAVRHRTQPDLGREAFRKVSPAPKGRSLSSSSRWLLTAYR